MCAVVDFEFASLKVNTRNNAVSSAAQHATRAGAHATRVWLVGVSFPSSYSFLTLLLLLLLLLIRTISSNARRQ